MKKMKRTIAMLISLLMIFSLAACGSSQTAAPAQSSAPAETSTTEEKSASSVKANLVMGTGGVSGSWYPVGGAMCNAMTVDGLNVTVQASGGTVENIRTVLNGERDFGFAGANVLADAVAGVGDFEGEDGSKLCSVISFMPMQAQWLVRADSGITSMEDFAGKMVGVGAVGSGDEVCARRLLDIVGLSYDDVDEQLLSIAEQATAFKDRHLDVMWTIAAAPTSGFLDASSQASCALVPIDGEIRDKIIENDPYYVPMTITSNEYSFLTEDVETIGFKTMVICNADLDEEVVYQALVNLFAQTETLRESHVSMADFGIETSAEGLDVLPIHPGALRFFQEQGIL